MSKSAMWGVAVLVVVVVAVVLVLILVPGSKTNKSTTKSNNAASSSSKNASDVKSIKSNFGTFFAVSTPMSVRERLLQNGSEFAQPMQSEFSQLDNEKPSVSISSVDLTTTNAAKVFYTVDLNGQPVLKDQTGEALLISGVWKVSDSTLCQLFSLSGTTPSICNNTK